MLTPWPLLLFAAAPTVCFCRRHRFRCCTPHPLLLAGGLTVRQQQVIGNLQRIRAVVKHHVAQVGLHVYVCGC